MQESALKTALGLGPAVAEGARTEGDSMIVSARPRGAAPRCPVCGRRCDGYDTLPARRRRAPDVGSARCYVEHAPRRAVCPEHGVKAEAVPWARSAPSRLTSSFGDQAAWLAPRTCRSALAELMGVGWRTVGGICARVGASLEEADGRGRFDGLRAVGVDETSHKQGRKHMAVVVDHDRGRVVWACAGHGKRQLSAFLDLLTEGQRTGIEAVTADGARRIADVVAERLPGAELAVGPLHAVSWATGALDELRRRSWGEARSRPAPKRRRGRPRKGEQAPPDPAGLAKGLGFPLLKNPEDLTEGQASALSGLKAAGAPPWRGYLPKEGLRAVFRAGPGRAAGELGAGSPGRAGAGCRSSSSSPGRSGASATGSCAPSRPASPTPAWRP